MYTRRALVKCVCGLFAVQSCQCTCTRTELVLGGSYESVRLSKLVGAAVKIPYLSVMISFLFLHTYVCTDII